MLHADRQKKISSKQNAECSIKSGECISIDASERGGRYTVNTSKLMRFMKWKKKPFGFPSAAISKLNFKNSIAALRRSGRFITPSHRFDLRSPIRITFKTFYLHTMTRIALLHKMHRKVCYVCYCGFKSGRETDPGLSQSDSRAAACLGANLCEHRSKCRKLGSLGVTVKMLFSKHNWQTASNTI